MSPPPVSSKPSSPRASRSVEEPDSWGGSTTGTPPACCTACRYDELTYARSGILSTVIDVVTPMRGALLMALCYRAVAAPASRWSSSYAVDIGAPDLERRQPSAEESSVVPTYTGGNTAFPPGIELRSDDGGRRLCYHDAHEPRFCPIATRPRTSLDAHDESDHGTAVDGVRRS